MKLRLFRIFAIALLSIAVQCTSFSASSNDNKEATFKKISKELVNLHKILNGTLVRCTLEDTCTAFLKFEKTLQPLLQSHTLIEKCDKSTVSKKQNVTLTLSSCKASLLKTQQKFNKICFYFPIEHACEYLIRNLRSGLPQKNRLQQNHSQSLLWPSVTDQEKAVMTVSNWYSICKELNSKCSLLEACAVILTHQLSLIMPIKSHQEFNIYCFKALIKKEKELSSIYPNLKPIDAYAYCITYPKSILSTKQKESIKAICPFEESYKKFLQKKAQNIQNEPHYVNKYRQTLTAEEKLTKGAYCIDGKPLMEQHWQKIVLAGYPRELKFFLKKFQDCNCSIEKIQKKRKLFFLHGYPGGGKTSAAQMLAIILKWPLVIIRCPGIQSEFQSSAAKNLERMLKPIFDSHYPWVICLDEIDALQQAEGNSARTNNLSQQRTMALGMLQQMADSADNPNVILIGTSNYASSIPKSTTDRFNVGIIYIPMPNYDARREIAQCLLEKESIKYSKDVLNIIARETGGMLPTFTTGLSSRSIEGIIYMIGELSNNKIATPKITQQAIKLVQKGFDQCGQPTTFEGRWLEKKLESPNFWPWMNWGTNVAFSLAGITFQALAEMRTGREENRSVEQLDLSKASFNHQKNTNADNLKIAIEGIKHQRKQTSNNTKQTSIALLKFDKQLMELWKDKNQLFVDTEAIQVALSIKPLTEYHKWFNQEMRKKGYK